MKKVFLASVAFALGFGATCDGVPLRVSGSRDVALSLLAVYELAAGAYCVMLISQHEGRIVDDAGMREIEALPSFAGTISMLGPGDQLKKTVDLFSCPGIIYLVDPDRAQLKRDYDRIRELDATGAVFEVEQLVAS